MATELTVENQDNIYRVHTYPVRIGRAKDNDIIVKAPFVADYHAVIEQGAQGLTIRSLEQSHANGERIHTTRPLAANYKDAWQYRCGQYEKEMNALAKNKTTR